MTVTNGHQNRSESTSERSGDDVLDALLDSLRTDQGGARTQALERALGHGAADGERRQLDALESDLRQLEREVSADETGNDSQEAASPDLEAVVDRLERLEATVDERRTEPVARDDAGAEGPDEIAALESTVETLDRRQTAIEEAIGELRSTVVSAQGAAEAADGDDAETAAPQSTTQSDLSSRIDHLERILDTRTSALASKARKVETLEARLDELETAVDDRTETLETDIDDVSETLEEAATMLQSETRDELETVRTELESRLDALESEFETAVASLEDDVDTLEWHAVDMIQWRKAYDDRAADEPADDATE